MIARASYFNISSTSLEWLRLILFTWKSLLFVCVDKRLMSLMIFIIATGVQDSKPNIKNFEMFDGNGAWHCPHCDRFQTTNKKLAIITYGKNTIQYVKEFLGWTRDITVFIQGIINYRIKIGLTPKP